MKHPDLMNPDMSWIPGSQRANIAAGVLMADRARTSLGPRGMEKMYVDILGEETVTKHGGAFLRKFDVDHPAAKAVVDGVNTVDTHAGDGTVTAAVLIGALLERAGGLLDSGVRTAAVVRGFEVGAGYALDALDAARVAGGAGAGRLVVETCLAGKAAALVNRGLADIVVEAVSRVGADTDMIKIEEKPGSFADAELVLGTVLDKPADSADMPRRADGVRVLLLNDPLEAARTRTESVIRMESPRDMGAYAEREARDVMDTVERVAESGAGLVVSRKGIGARAQAELARRGIVSVRRVKYNDLWWLERATGASTCSGVDCISPGELGFADTVLQREVGGEDMVFVVCAAPRSVTILLRAGTKRYLDEFHRTALNAARALGNYRECPYVVPGGGACEAAMARAVRERAPYAGGRLPAVLEGFASALEEIPATLARNAGMDVLDALPRLRSRCAGDAGGGWGIDSAARRVDRVRGVLDTYAVKRQILNSAVETACQILNVDDTFMKDLVDNTHCHLDGTVHAHRDPGRNHNHWEQEGLEQRQMHQYY